MAVSRRFAKLSLYLTIFIISLCKVHCNVVVMPEVLYYNISTTSRADFFVVHNQRQFAATTDKLDQELLDFKLNFMNRLETINLHTALLETKFNEVDYKFNPMEMLDDVHDHCVQKYRSKLPLIATLKAAMANCIAKGTNFYPNIVSAADTALRNLKNHYITPFKNSLTDCKKKFPKSSEANYTTCVQTAVRTATTVTFQQNNLFVNHMKAAACTATTKIKEVFDCAADVVFPAFHAIGQVTGLVDNCIEGHEFCPSCVDDSDIIKGRCPYHMSWHLSDHDLINAQIDNPFKGITKTTPCLQINFITKNIGGV